MAVGMIGCDVCCLKRKRNRMSNDMPLYKQMIRELENGILTGRFLPGTCIPPVRELASYQSEYSAEGCPRGKTYGTSYFFTWERCRCNKGHGYDLQASEKTVRRFDIRFSFTNGGIGIFSWIDSHIASDRELRPWINKISTECWWATHFSSASAPLLLSYWAFWWCGFTSASDSLLAFS